MVRRPTAGAPPPVMGPVVCRRGVADRADGAGFLSDRLGMLPRLGGSQSWSWRWRNWRNWFPRRRSMVSSRVDRRRWWRSPGTGRTRSRSSTAPSTARWSSASSPETTRRASRCGPLPSRGRSTPTVGCSALEAGDTAFVVSRLHPVVIDAWGADLCSELLVLRRPHRRLRRFCHCLSFPLTRRRVSISDQQADTPYF